MSASALLWSFGQQIGRQASGYLVFAILAVLLSPGDFGLVAFAGVWLSVMGVFVELGFGTALVQRQKLESGHLSSALALNVALGVGLTLAGVLLSWSIARAVRTPAVQPVVAALSVGFLLSAVSVTQVALAQREYRFRALALRDVTSSLAGGAVGIALAAMGAGVWSLVAQSLTGNAVAGVLLWRLSPWRPRLQEVSAAYIRDLWPYSSRIVLYNLFKSLAQNIDQVIIGYLLGPVALGTYFFASKLIFTPMTAIRSAFGAYLFPKFSRLQDDAAAVAGSYEFFLKAIATCVTPIMAGAAVMAPLLVPMLFGIKWSAAVPVIQIFTVVALVQAFMAPVGELMKALNRPGWMLWWSVGLSATIAAAIAIGARFGIVGAAVGLAMAHTLTLPIVYAITRRLIATTLRSVVRAAIPATVAAACLGVAMLVALQVAAFPPDTRIVIAVILGSLAFVLVLRVLDRDFVLAIRRWLLSGHRGAHA